MLLCRIKATGLRSATNQEQKKKNDEERCHGFQTRPEFLVLNLDTFKQATR